MDKRSARENFNLRFGEGPGTTQQAVQKQFTIKVVEAITSRGRFRRM